MKCQGHSLKIVLCICPVDNKGRLPGMKIVQILQKNFRNYIYVYICFITKYKNIYACMAGDENQGIYLTWPKVKFVCTVRKCTSLLAF